MIRFLQHTEIDKKKWDERVATSPQGEVYAFSWYLDIVSPGWCALAEDEYSEIFPLTWRKKFGFHYLFQPPFTQQLGVFGGKEISSGRLSEFLGAIPDKFRLIEIQLNAGNPETDVKQFSFLKKRTHWLELSSAIEKIRSGYSENLRRNLKKANVPDFQFSDEFVDKDVIKLWKENRGRTIETLEEDDYKILEKLLAAARERNLLEIISLKNKNNALIASAIFIRSVHSWIFLFSATSDEAKKSGGMGRVIDHFISSHCSQNLRLDFEGSMDDNLSRFYKSFGSREVVYLQIRKNNLPPLIRWLK